MENKKLQIGDKVYCRRYGELSYFGEIDRVSVAFAFIRSVRFKREYGGRYLTLTPREKWESTSYFIPNESDIAELEKIKLIKFVCDYDYSKLPIEKLLEIREVIKR